MCWFKRQVKEEIGESIKGDTLMVPFFVSLQGRACRDHARLVQNFI